jgi:ribonucrease Y
MTHLVTLAAGLAGGAVVVWWSGSARLRKAHSAATEAQAAATADRAARAAADAQAQSLRDQAARVAGDAASVDARMATLVERDAAAGRRAAALDQRAADLAEQELELRKSAHATAGAVADLATRVSALDAREAGIAERLQAIAGLSRDAARDELFRRLDDELAAESAARIARNERSLDERAKTLAIEHVTRAIQRYAAEHTAASTAVRVPIADEDMKGRIIGKEGRNIRAFEQATGVDVLIDDVPGSVGISCFDPVRRETARRTLVRLIEDGRIQPGRIDEVLAQTALELDREIVRHGEDAALACEVSGLHPQVVRLLGKLHFRTSYGQNVLQHTQEVAHLCGAMAADLGLDPRLGRRCGLLHDLGKAIDHEQEGSHPELGHAALIRYGESEIVANAALAHHEGHPVLSVYTVLAAAADAISAARPGARHHSKEAHVQRLQQLEEIACAMPGVQKAYAIQAGRELRVIVNQHTVPDAQLPRIARDIARQIADQVAIPGDVKVTLIRETRVFAVAR